MRLNYISLKVVRWTAWPLLLVISCFLVTGYTISGRFGLGTLLNEETALAWHKMLHLPLILLLLVHTVPAVYLAFLRWGWIGKKSTGGPQSPPGAA